MHYNAVVVITLGISAMTSGNLSYSRDDGWDRPMVESKGRKRYDEIDKWLYMQGLMCRSQGGQYVFVDTDNSWCNLASHEAMSRIVTLAGIDNVSISQDKAMRPFNNYIIKRCDSRVSMPIPLSVCIGTKRLEIDIETAPGTIKFFTCRPLLRDMPARIHPSIATLSIMPVSMDVYPIEYTFPGKGVVMNHLMDLFSDPRDAVTLFWHVGNCILDPVSKPKSVMLVGPGGTGKSTLLRQLISCLGTCVNTIPDGSLTTKTKSMPPGVAEAVVGSRMVICFDVDLEKAELNMSTFKNISGSDYIRVGSITAVSNCSLTLATNGVVNITKEPEYNSDAIMRRVVAIRMNVNAMTIPSAVIPEDGDVRLDFVCMCLYIRSRYDFMPVAPMTVLTTLCASKIDDVVDKIEETLEPVDEVQANGVLMILSVVLGFTTQQITQKIALISPGAVISLDGCDYIKGLRPIVT